MFIPPKSARKAVRVRNAAVINGLSNTYLSLMSSWVGDKRLTLGRGKIDEESESIDHVRGQLLAIATQLLPLKTLTESARWESNVLGKWPYEDYKIMLEIEQDMLAILVQVCLFLRPPS